MVIAANILLFQRGIQV